MKRDAENNVDVASWSQPRPFTLNRGDAGAPVILAPSHVLLRQARLAKGMSLQQVADACGINIRQYQKFESGERDLGGCAFSLGLRLCRTLELDPWLFSADATPIAPARTEFEGVPRRMPPRQGEG